MFAFIKIFPWLMPFLKEMILGKKTWGQAFKDNKKKTIFAVLVIISFGLNFILVPKLTVLATQYVALNREFNEYRLSHPDRAMSTQKHPLDSGGKEVTVEVKTTPPKDQVANATPSHSKTNQATDEIKAEFNRIRDREASEH